MSAEIIGNRYHLLEKLGMGGMGVVYRAQDRLTGDMVAIKRVNNPLAQVGASKEESIKFRLGLAQEFRVLATMRHPNIISVLDYGFDQHQQSYYTMEYLANAQNILVYGQNKSLIDKLDLLIQTLQAIVYLHRRGIIHRDLKPDNILVIGEQVKVLDFGLAIAYNHAPEKSNLAGTIAYMSPEIIMGQPPSFASDLYALGIIAYELFARHHPYSLDSVQSLLENILQTKPDVDALVLPDVIADSLMQLLAKDPTDRYQDAEIPLKLYAEFVDKPLNYETATIRESYLQSARFVGRTQEISQLNEGLSSVHAQHGSMWLVGGESGVGKSRLMEEIRTSALVNGFLVLRGQAIVEGGASYLLWRSVMRYLCLKIALSDLEASVLKALVPDISTLIGRSVPDVPPLDPDAEQTRLLNVLEAVFRRHTEPMLIILEDLQWARESLLVVNKLAKIIANLPLMIVGTFRDDESPHLASLFAEAHTLRLNRLTNTEIADLSESILGKTIGRRDSLIELLQVETEGNAFFIVEIVRTLAEEAGQLSQIGKATLPPTVFAGGIRAAIQQRLAHVPRRAYALLELMAVAGRELDLRLLSQLMPLIEIDKWVLDCNSVLEVQDNMWRFAHDKLREAILAQIPPAQLLVCHQQIAQAIQEAYPNDPAYYVRLAYHWHEANENIEESRFSWLAGKNELAVGNYQEAIRLLQRTLAIFQTNQMEPKRQASLAKQIGDAYFGLGKLSETEGYLVQALAPLAHVPPRTNRTLYRKIFTNALHQARFRFLPMQQPQPADGDYLRDAANACLQLAIIYYFKNNKFYALYYSLKGTNLANRAGVAHTDELTRLQAIFAMIASLIPLHGLARMYHRLARRNLAQQDSSLRSWVLMMAGIYATNTTEWDIAVPSLLECITLAEEVGNIRRYQESLLSLAAVYFFMGEWTKSSELAEKIVASGVEYDNLQCQAWGYDDLGRVHYHHGEYAPALALFAKSRDIYEQIQDQSGLIWVYGALAQVHTRLGDLETARPHAEKVKNWLVNTSPTNYGLLEGYQGLADFYLTQYEQDPTIDNRHNAELVVKLVHRFGRIFNTGKAHRYIYESWLAGVDGDTQKCLRIGKVAIQEAKRYSLPYEEGLANFHTARFLPPNHPQRAFFLAQAQRIFQQMNAQWDIERVNKYL